MRSIIVGEREVVLWKSIDERVTIQEAKAPSEMFLDAVGPDRSSLVVECGFCQRIYFGDGGDYDRGEREHYEEMAKLNPDKYIEVSDFTRVYEVNGVEYAEGCPCNGIRVFEVMFWNNRRQIVKYLKARTKDNLKTAKYEAELMNGLEVNGG